MLLPLSALLLVAVATQKEVRLDKAGDWWSLYQAEHAASEAYAEHRGDVIEKSWARRKIFHHEINPAHFTVAGIKLGRNSGVRSGDVPPATMVTAKLGAAATVVRGDGAESREQVCYTSAKEPGSRYVVFEEGDLDYSFYILDQSVQWNGSRYCAESNVIDPNVRSGGGLGIGMSRDAILAILGQPSLSGPDFMEYDYQTKARPGPDELAPFKRHGVSPEELAHFGSYDYGVRVRATFSRSGLRILAVERDKAIW